MDINNTKRLFKRSVTQILLNNPFFASLLLNANVEFTTKIPTMATDGKNILVNLGFVDSIKPKEIQGVLIHEILHMVYLHASRRKERNHMRFNMACDYAINPIVIDEGFVLPKGGLLSDEYRGMTAEEIYTKLPDDEEMPKEMMDLQDNLSPIEQKQAAQDMKIAISKAIQAAGEDVPDAIKSTLQEILEPVVNWRLMLREFIQTSLGGDENTWKRPNRNYLHDDLYIPSTEGTTMPSIAVMIDTSGSIFCNKALFEAFSGEVNNIIEDLVPEQVDIFYVDTRIQAHNTYEEGEIPTYELQGGGGTNFVSAWPEMEKVDPSCIIAFTDAYATFPTHSNTPTLWAVYGNDSPMVPFGKTIIIKED